MLHAGRRNAQRQRLEVMGELGEGARKRLPFLDFSNWLRLRDMLCCFARDVGPRETLVRQA